MPAKPLMSWSKTQRRWEKMYKGGRYWVTCSELNLPPHKHNKEDSYQAANQWWEAKLARLQAAALQAHPHRPRLDELAAHRDAARALGEHPDADVLDAEIIRVAALPPDYDPEDEEGTPPRGTTSPSLATVGTTYVIGQPIQEPDRPADIDPQTAAVIQGLRALGVPLDDPVVAAIVSKVNAVRADRAKKATTTPPEKTIGALVRVWLDGRRAEHGAGDRSAVSVSSLRKAITHFETFVGPANPPAVIDFDLWERWYLHCKAKLKERDGDAAKLAGWSALTAGSYFRTSRMFVRWLWERDILTPPKNWNSTKHTFGRPTVEPPTFTNPEIKRLLDAASGVHKLLILLMLNCGMTQQDISDLRRDEIDLAAGRITRYRSKMKKKRSARLVSYRLWPEVIDLLKEHMAKDGERALVTRTGAPWVWREITDTGEKKSDNVRSVFDKLKRRAGVTGPNKAVKMFRKTSATRIKGNREYADLRHWFLGHGEKSMADRHYAASTQDQLDAAVDWLRTQYDL